MDALVTECSWNTNDIMLWAGMLRSLYALESLKHERYHALGMDALDALPTIYLGKSHELQSKLLVS